MERSNKKLPVLFVGTFLSSAICTRGVCEDLAAELMRLGWPVLTTSNKQARLLRLVDMLNTVWRKRKQYALAQVDVYSGMAFIWAEAVCCMLRLINKPYILTLHGGNLPAFSERHAGRVSRLLNSAGAVTTPSRYLLEQMAKYRRDLCLLANPIFLERYKFSLRQKPEPRLVWLRAFHDVYNPSLAVRALSLLTEAFPTARLIMFGPDKGDGSLEATETTARQLGVVDRVSFAGKVKKSEVPDLLHQGDIFLNTTHVDNTPVSILEAMASGMCIVSTNVGGIPYLLEHEHSALLVTPDNAGEMATAVRRILTEPGLAARLSKNASKAAEKFDWAHILPQWESLMKSVAEVGVSRDLNGRVGLEKQSA